MAIWPMHHINFFLLVNRKVLSSLKRVITKTTGKSQTSHRRLQTSHRRVQTSHRRATGGNKRVTDDSQTSHRQLQTSHRRLQTSHRQLQTNLRQIQLSHRPLQVTWTTEVCLQPLTWFNKFIYWPSDICYYALWFVYKTSE